MNATPEDMIKFAHTKAVLLLKVACYAQPLQVQIDRTAGDGQYFSTGGNMFSSASWFETNETEIIEILHSPELPRPKPKIPDALIDEAKGLGKILGDIERAVIYGDISPEMEQEAKKALQKRQEAEITAFEKWQKEMQLEDADDDDDDDEEGEGYVGYPFGPHLPGM